MDLSFTDNEFAIIWVEINNAKTKEYFESVLAQLCKENKSIFTVTEFNANLPNFGSHPKCNDFVLKC